MAPFTKDEIDGVVKEMPVDRAPGPDDFSGLLLKACWPIIKEDFYTLCTQFHAGELNLQSISDGLITLIPKNGSPTTVNDYRPITLLNCCLKLITKLLANRLQKVILRIIHRNQYGFIKAINDAFTRGLIHLPFPSNGNMDYLIVQYADDTILLMPACPRQAVIIKNILSDYAQSIGLKINFHKSTLIPINLDQQMTADLATIFGCSIGSMPFTYLGLPLGTSRPSLNYFMPLKDLWADRLLQESHPRAFSYAINDDVSVCDFLGITSLGLAFHLPLSPKRATDKAL
ncbi:uncharacterized protein [Aegilops tauschii subsp. strangulata]|uniref:uncharacterized protein n=1 Tax=Aegilops tauschii subsp. strangulata TaxID=200361 RepID=UPI003CC86B6A